MAILMT